MSFDLGIAGSGNLFFCFSYLHFFPALKRP